MKFRFKSILLLLLLLSGGLIILKNSLDERDISIVNEDVDALYQDRLMASHYIYSMNDLLHKKRGFYVDAVSAGKETIERSSFREDIAATMQLYGNTKLTAEEKKAFDHFRDLVQGVYVTEEGKHVTSAVAWAKIATIDKALSDLKVLADIQVKEARVLKSHSGEVLSGALLAIRLEWVLLIVAGLMFVAFLRERILLPSRIEGVKLN